MTTGLESWSFYGMPFVQPTGFPDDLVHLAFELIK
jgi:hypothetical protein